MDEFKLYTGKSDKEAVDFQNLVVFGQVVMGYYDLLL